MDLEHGGKVAIVTGAGKGIGVAAAAALLDEGAHVVATSRTNTPDLEALAARGADVVLGDITDDATPDRLVGTALRRHGRLDVLVNNVGAGSPRQGFLDVPDDEWHRIFDVTFFSAVRMARAALPALLDGGGVIVNVSSINARLPFPMVVDYSAAKAALSNLGKALSEEFAPRGVRVNTVSPGPVRTPMWEADGGGADAMAAQAGVDRETALLQVIPQAMGLSTGSMASPEEVAALVLLLASPVCANVTGADWTVDSGFLKAT